MIVEIKGVVRGCAEGGMPPPLFPLSGKNHKKNKKNKGYQADFFEFSIGGPPLSPNPSYALGGNAAGGG